MEQSHLPEEPQGLPPTIPAQTTPPAGVPASEPLVTVRMGNQEFQLPQSAAEAFQAELQSSVQGLRDDLGQTQQQLDTMTRQWQTVQQVFQPPGQQQQTQDLNLLYTDPMQWRQSVLNEAAQQTQTMMAQQQNQQNFWSNFYRDNPQLDTRIVNSAIANSADLQRAPYTPETAKKLAEEATALALGIAQKFAGQQTTPTPQPVVRALPRTTVESGRTPIASEQPPAEEPPQQRRTMADMRKTMRERRRTAS